MRRVMILFGLVVATASSGCTAVNSIGKNPNQVGRAEETRVGPRGVCSSINTGGAFAVRSVTACARMLGTEPSLRPVLLSEFSASGDENRSNPGNWRLQVTSPSGSVLLDSVPPMAPARSFWSKLMCVWPGTVCLYAGRAVSVLPQPWEPGSYRLRYTFVPDADSYDLTITLL